MAEQSKPGAIHKLAPGRLFPGGTVGHLPLAGNPRVGTLTGDIHPQRSAPMSAGRPPDRFSRRRRSVNARPPHIALVDLNLPDGRTVEILTSLYGFSALHQRWLGGRAGAQVARRHLVFEE
jgi:hypothetical protein